MLSERILVVIVFWPISATSGFVGKGVVSAEVCSPCCSVEVKVDKSSRNEKRVILWKDDPAKFSPTPEAVEPGVSGSKPPGSSNFGGSVQVSPASSA